MAATTSILRNYHWILGILNSYDNNNFVVFCSSLRGLIESGGDVLYTLIDIPKFIASNLNEIRLIIKCRFNS